MWGINDIDRAIISEIERDARDIADAEAEAEEGGWATQAANEGGWVDPLQPDPEVFRPLPAADLADEGPDEFPW